MNVTIENNNFKAIISTLGAEIQSLTGKNNGTEYIWNGDASVWKSHAPILFPFIGRCLENYFIIEGQTCEYTKNHGFVRESETTIIYQDQTRVVFELKEGDNTLYRFPYKFSLIIEYEIVEDGLNWKITVNNTDTKAFKFGVGTHAAFTCPRNTDPDGTKNSDYVIEFEKREHLKGALCNLDGFLACNERNGTGPAALTSSPATQNKDGVWVKPYGEKEPGFVPLTDKGFGNGHLITGFTSNWVGLRNKKDNSIIKISTEGFPYCMLWQNTSGKPSFVCIEPWHGLPDFEDTNHIWDEKKGMNPLEPGASFVSEQNIRISW